MPRVSLHVGEALQHCGEPVNSRPTGIPSCLSGNVPDYRIKQVTYLAADRRRSALPHTASWRFYQVYQDDS